MKHLPSRIALFLSALALLLPTAALAACSDEDSMPAEVCRHVSQLWDEGGDDLYVPLHTHHLRSAYSDEQIAHFNETPWGLGYGRSRTEDGHWEALYGMVFQDSHNKPEPMVGYAYQWLWSAPQNVRAGLGYTLLVTARDDLYSYTPLPGILPIASLQYGKVSLNTTYVPGGRGFGNILFFWSRIEL
jgi:palmitoyl transferase